MPKLNRQMKLIILLMFQWVINDLIFNIHNILKLNALFSHFSEQTEFDNMTVADQNAIHACRTLRRKPVVLEDLRPVDSSQLEYSYRPLNEFNQFWAGPSHWKFRKYSGAHVARRSKIDQQTKHSTRTKTLKNKIEPVQFVEANVPEELSPKITSMILLKSKAAEKVKRMNSYRKWDSKKLKLPTNMQFDRNFFNFYTYALSLAMDENEPESTPAINETGYNYDNADDREYCSNNNVVMQSISCIYKTKQLN